MKISLKTYFSIFMQFLVNPTLLTFDFPLRTALHYHHPIPITYLHQSFSSNVKISSTVVLNVLAILRESKVEGTYLPTSIELMVCLETLTFSANSPCVIFCFARSTFIVFFISILY